MKNKTIADLNQQYEDNMGISQRSEFRALKALWLKGKFNSPIEKMYEENAVDDTFLIEIYNEIKNKYYNLVFKK